MSRWPLVLLFLAATCAAVARAETKTVCTITVNSDDEKETFRKRLPPGHYKFVELLERGREDWLHSACEEHVQCDVLMISGHFNAGETFYSDKVDVEESLKVDELERASCSQSCPALFSKLKEVYLFGCESLNPDPTKYASTYGESGRERMRRIFANVPSIYGFYSSAPIGPTAAMLLNRYFDAGGSARFATGRPNAKLLAMFSHNHMTRVSGMTEADPGWSTRHQICEFFDERPGPGDKVRFVHDMMRRDPTQAVRFLERIEHLFAGFTEAQRETPQFSAALAELSADDATRDRYLAIERGEKPAMRTRMIALATTFGWLSPAARRDELTAMLNDLFASRSLGFGDADLVCGLNTDHTLDASLAKLRAPVAQGAAAQAALACLGSPDARRRIVAALASPRPEDVEIAELYLRYHPLGDGAQLRAVADEVARMPPSPAQLQALGALARMHIADRAILDDLARAFAQAKSVNVQRAIAEVFIRSDPDALPKPDLAGILRDHRLKSPDGHPDLIDVLIRQLAG